MLSNRQGASELQLTRRKFLRVPAQVPEPIRFETTCLNSAGVQCRSCADTCPERALRLIPHLGGTAHIQLAAAACTRCGECIAVCPANAIRLQPQSNTP